MLKLSIVIPIYNEQKTLETLITKVNAIDYSKEIILVDDFSTDGTREILKGYENKENFKVLYHNRNQGKGAA